MQLDSRILQNVNVAAICFPFQRLCQFGDCVTIELVVAEDINDRLARELFPNPLAPFTSRVNVAGEHHNVCIYVRKSPMAKLQMQVTEDVQSHVHS